MGGMFCLLPFYRGFVQYRRRSARPVFRDLLDRFTDAADQCHCLCFRRHFQRVGRSRSAPEHFARRNFLRFHSRSAPGRFFQPEALCRLDGVFRMDAFTGRDPRVPIPKEDAQRQACNMINVRV